MSEIGRGVTQMAKDMDRVDFQKGDLLLDQGAPQTKAFFIADGTIKRERVVNDQSHQVDARLRAFLPTALCAGPVHRAATVRDVQK